MMPELVRRLSKNWFREAMYGVMGRLPFYRHLVRHLRYEFSGKLAAKAAEPAASALGKLHQPPRDLYTHQNCSATVTGARCRTESNTWTLRASIR
jgi:hypothetical protein